MAVPYTKTNVGDKLFTISWNLNPDQPTNDIGDVFEAVDCELLSVFAHTPEVSGFDTVLNVSNWPTAPADSIFATLNLNGVALSKETPRARYYWPRGFGVSSVAPVCKVALLFKEL